LADAQFNVDLLEDIVEYWVEILGSEEYFPCVDRHTVITLRHYSDGAKKDEVGDEPLNKRFQDARNETDDPETRLFSGLPEAHFPGVYTRFLRQTKRGRGMRTFQSLNTGTKSTLEVFYQVMEHIPYLIDEVARTGYKGGSPIQNRPRVETSLTPLGKRQYYAIAWYCICNWPEMASTSTYRPHEALVAAGKDKEMTYWNQYKYRVWFQLAFQLHEWGQDFKDFPRLMQTVRNVKSFTVSHPCRLGLTSTDAGPKGTHSGTGRKDQTHDQGVQ
jgi:hypothetical protein